MESSSKLVDRIENFEGLVAVLTSGKIKLSKRLKQVAHFVLNNPEDVAIHNIVELAQMADVPVSTITRFTKELNFAGFGEMQSVFRQRLLGPRRAHFGRLRGIADQITATDEGQELDFDDPIAVFDSFVQSGVETLYRLREEVEHDSLLRFVEVLTEARTVYIIAGRGAFGVGVYFFYGLSLTGKQAILVDNLGSMRAEQLKFVGKDDVILAISFDSYTQETISEAVSAAKQGHRVLTITDNEMSPISRIGVATLYVREARLGHFRSQIPAMALCQSIIVSVGRNLSRLVSKQ
jgi:DNA-binding MurR/RpiR family transcriptional regulator